MRQKINELLKANNPHTADAFNCLPEYFFDVVAVVGRTGKSEKIHSSIQFEDAE